MVFKAVIFDLDGVIVSTDEYHYRAWKKVCDEEGILFNREINQKLRGISRMESLEIILRNSKRRFTCQEEKEMASRKNEYYRHLLLDLKHDDILPDVLEIIRKLKGRGLKVAIGSSSRNAKLILDRLGLVNTFDAIVDGTLISRSKPDPEVFLLAARELGVEPNECIVIEDANAGIGAALKAGAKAIGVGYASNNRLAHLCAFRLSDIDIEELLSIKSQHERRTL